MQAVLNHEDKIVWVRFENKVGDTKYIWYIAFVYIVPSTSTCSDQCINIYETIENDMHDFISNDPDCKFLVCGDLNAHTGDLKDYIEHNENREYITQNNLEHIFSQ